MWGHFPFRIGLGGSKDFFVCFFSLALAAFFFNNMALAAIMSSYSLKSMNLALVKQLLHS
jgi:hypothetical protein